MVAVEQPLISDSVLNDMIGVWRHARLSGWHAQGYPSGLMGRLVEFGLHALAAMRGRVGLPPEWKDEDLTPYIIQDIVEKMPYEMRSVFEAYHLAVVRGERCTGSFRPHKARAALLSISEATYYRRREAAHDFVRRWMCATIRATACP